MRRTTLLVLIACLAAGCNSGSSTTAVPAVVGKWKPTPAAFTIIRQKAIAAAGSHLYDPQHPAIVGINHLDKMWTEFDADGRYFMDTNSHLLEGTFVESGDKVTVTVKASPEHHGGQATFVLSPDHKRLSIPGDAESDLQRS